MKPSNRPIDYAPGQRFGVVTVAGPAPSRRGRAFRVVCDCGAVRVAVGSSLRQRPPFTHKLCGAARARQHGEI